MNRPELLGYSMCTAAAKVRGHRGAWMRWLIRLRNRFIPWPLWDY